MKMIFDKASCPSDIREAIEFIADKIGAKLYPLKEFQNPGQPAIGNVYAHVTEVCKHSAKFTIRTRYSKKHGSRTSASGRHMPKASWEAHRDVMLALFEVWPTATLRTAHATYKGRKHFLETFEATGDHNVGNAFHPVTIRSCSI